MTFDSDVTFPLLKDVKAQKPDAVCEARPTNVNSNILVNRDKPPFDNAADPPGHGAGARQPGLRRHPEPGPRPRRRGHAAAAGTASGACPRRCCRACSAIRPTSRRAAPRRARSWRRLGYGPDKPLKIKVATRNIAIYRDPAVILIDQLKKIYIEGELDPIDTTVWYTKIQRKDYQVGMNLTGVGVDDPDVNFYENYYSTSDRNYTSYKNPEVDKLIDQQSAEIDRDKRKKLVWEIEKKLADDAARPIIGYNVANTCWDAASSRASCCRPTASTTAGVSKTSGSIGREHAPIGDKADTPSNHSPLPR